MGRRKAEMTKQTIKVRIPQQLLDDIELLMVEDHYPGDRQDFIGHLLARGLSSYIDIKRYILDGVHEGKLRKSVLLGSALDELHGRFTYTSDGETSDEEEG